MRRTLRSRQLGVATIALVGSIATVPFIALACSNAETTTFGASTTEGEGSGAGGPSGTGGAGSGGNASGNGTGGDIFIDPPPPATDVTTPPTTPKLKVELPLTGQTVQFKCLDTKTMAPVTATWKLSN